MANGKSDDDKFIIFDKTNKTVISYPVLPLSAAISN